jgi:hypothetical protein
MFHQGWQGGWVAAECVVRDESAVCQATPVAESVHDIFGQNP